jgi:hypothetical protein
MHLKRLDGLCTVRSGDHIMALFFQGGSEGELQAKVIF